MITNEVEKLNDLTNNNNKLCHTIFLRIRSWSLNMMRWRAVTGVFFQEGKACLAALTASLNSS